MKTKSLLFLLTMALLFSCEEKGRFAISEDSKTPPDPPRFLNYKPLVGGAMLYYELPDVEDLLTIDAEFTAPNGKLVWFSASYFVDSLAVYGFAEEKEYEIQLYATNRAGVKSTKVPVKITPFESALPQVTANIEVKPAVRSFLLDWENEQKQMLDVYVDFSFTEGGNAKSYTRVFSSNKEIERQFILDLDIDENTPIHVKVWVEDLYGNKSEVVDKGQVFVLQDVSLNDTKPEWSYPLAGTIMDGIVMANGSNVEGRIYFLSDNIIDHANITNFIHTNQATPWNIFIDLGDYYELTRIATWQRRFHSPPSAGDPGHDNLGALYDNSENVGRYAMYRWDEDTDSWEFLSEHRIPNLRNMGLGTLEIVTKHYRDGDEAYILPDPGYTKPTRWFRYEALAGFQNDYTRQNDIQCLSELSLFGRKYKP